MLGDWSSLVEETTGISCGMVISLRTSSDGNQMKDRFLEMFAMGLCQLLLTQCYSWHFYQPYPVMQTEN
jgi:hypothetical protein